MKTLSLLVGLGLAMSLPKGAIAAPETTPELSVEWCLTPVALFALPIESPGHYSEPPQLIYDSSDENQSSHGSNPQEITPIESAVATDPAEGSP
ncbi:MAG: hypothetical protein VKJ24_15520 [Synechococcales bacterium]|nr:hypothetical protein [Synechococcales bacterium]